MTWSTLAPVAREWAEWAEPGDILRRGAGLACGFYCLGVWLLAAERHGRVVRGTAVHGDYFREGYFATLAIQIIPLLVTGFAVGDEFVIWTRSILLMTVVGSHALATSADGTLTARRYRVGILLWTTALILGPMSWVHDGVVRRAVQDHQTLVSWTVVATVVLFTVRGQWLLALDMFRHFASGDRELRRLGVQVPRLLMFALPAPHYWIAPSGAAPVLGMDPVLVACLTGGTGTLVVIVLSMLGEVLRLIRDVLRLVWGLLVRLLLPEKNTTTIKLLNNEQENPPVMFGNGEPYVSSDWYWYIVRKSGEQR